MGIIPQTPFLWADTIENNIKYGKRDATRKDVDNALNSTSGTDWINDLSKGLRTKTGERGSLISMGQRQLVVFARVLLENPAILILDEATSSLDTITEQRIHNAILGLQHQHTSVIIAHRLSTIKNADQVIVLKNGCVVETGKPEQLLAQKQEYFHMVQQSRDSSHPR